MTGVWEGRQDWRRRAGILKTDTAALKMCLVGVLWCIVLLSVF